MEEYAVGDHAQHELQGEDEQVAPLKRVNQRRLRCAHRVQWALPRHRDAIDDDGAQYERLEPPRLDEVNRAAPQRMRRAEEAARAGRAVHLTARTDHLLGRWVPVERLQTCVAAPSNGRNLVAGAQIKACVRSGANGGQRGK